VFRSIRSGRGLGDSLYLQGVVRYYVEKGYKGLEVCSDYPDVFRPLDGRVNVVPFRRRMVDRIAHYTNRKGLPNTHQFQDCCLSAGIQEHVPFVLDWDIMNVDLVERVKYFGQRIALVQLPRYPMARADAYGIELLPDCKTIQRAVDRLRKLDYCVIQIGQGNPLFQFKNISLDLANKTTVSDVIDLAWSSDMILGYCSFAAPLAECLNKPALFVWSTAGLVSQDDFIRLITPKKILGSKRSRTVLDTCSDEEMEEVLCAIHNEIRSSSDIRG
jgi:hypothetical protein